MSDFKEEASLTDMHFRTRVHPVNTALKPSLGVDLSLL